MINEKYTMFRNRLAKVFRHLSRQAKRLRVSCYRVYDHDLPEFPLSIDIYEDNLYVAEYKRQHGMTVGEHDTWLRESLNVIMEVFKTPQHRIFLKLRQQKRGRYGQYQKIAEQQNEYVINEGGLKFIINLSDYLDTGLFLDHRMTRQAVKEEAKNKKVLNMFCYTGTFSVYAAAGGAEEVASVDLSNTYLNWAKRNMQLNGFTNPVKYKYDHADARQYLNTIKTDYFDLIVMDPPTFSNSKQAEGFLDVQRDHVEMLNDCLSGLVPNGVIYFSTNSRKFILDKEKIKATSVKDITKATTPFDFEGRLHRYGFRIVK
jgi:23S rRNA (cytosine1962-C5)-methyltransferase